MFPQNPVGDVFSSMNCDRLSWACAWGIGM